MTDIEIPEGFTRWEFIPHDTRVELIYRNGFRETGWAGMQHWFSEGVNGDIIAYRVLP